jgi:D-glycero-D-manno-heptose 1,7-bisphosphate phosphatase
MVKAVFFDRDGVLTKLISRGDIYTAPWDIDEFEFLPYSKQAVDIVKDLGYKAFCVTNQPDINDEKMTETTFQMMCEIVCTSLGIDDIIAAFERGDAYYKPNTGMVDELVEEYDIDKSESYIIGDTWKDIVCGYRAGLKTIFVGQNYSSPPEYTSVLPDYKVDDVFEAAKLIERLEND